MSTCFYLAAVYRFKMNKRSSYKTMHYSVFRQIQHFYLQTLIQVFEGNACFLFFYYGKGLNTVFAFATVCWHEHVRGETYGSNTQRGEERNFCPVILVTATSRETSAGGTLRGRKRDCVRTSHRHHVNAYVSPPRPRAPAASWDSIKACSHRSGSTEEARPLRWVAGAHVTRAGFTRAFVVWILTFHVILNRN